METPRRYALINIFNWNYEYKLQIEFVIGQYQSMWGSSILFTKQDWTITVVVRFDKVIPKMAVKLWRPSHMPFYNLHFHLRDHEI